MKAFNPRLDCFSYYINGNFKYNEGIVKDERLCQTPIRLSLTYCKDMTLRGWIVNLDKHFNLASKDVDEIRVSAKKASKRAL